MGSAGTTQAGGTRHGLRGHHQSCRPRAAGRELTTRHGLRGHDQGEGHCRHTLPTSCCTTSGPAQEPGTAREEPSCPPPTQRPSMGNCRWRVQYQPQLATWSCSKAKFLPGPVRDTHMHSKHARAHRKPQSTDETTRFMVHYATRMHRTNLLIEHHIVAQLSAPTSATPPGLALQIATLRNHASRVTNLCRAGVWSLCYASLVATTVAGMLRSGCCFVGGWRS